MMKDIARDRYTIFVDADYFATTALGVELRGRWFLYRV